jgi:hypothetical protein
VGVSPRCHEAGPECGGHSWIGLTNYGSEEEFLAGTVPFVRDGLECGDPIRVVTTDRNSGWLRAVLGVDAGRVAFGESSQWYRHPVRALAAVYRTVQAAS